MLFQPVFPHLPGSEVAGHLSHETLWEQLTGELARKIYMEKTDVYIEDDLLLITAITALKAISTSLCLME